MKSTFVSLLSAALLVARVAGQSLQINTPANVVVCQPVQFSWSGGTGPYFLSILPGDQPSAAALENLGTQTGTSVTWLADIAAGTSIGLTLRDSTGATAQSAAFSINPGTDTSCIGKNSASGSSSSTGTATGTTTTGTTTGTTPSTPITTSSGAATTTAATTTPKAATTTTTSPGTSKTGTSTTGSATTATTTSSSKNAGPTQAASFGAAGIVGAAVIALLA